MKRNSLAETEEQEEHGLGRGGSYPPPLRQIRFDEREVETGHGGAREAPEPDRSGYR
jgi:hypothetical protein